MAVDGDGYDQSVSELVWLPYAPRFAFVLHTVTAKSTRRAYHTRPDLYVVSADGSDDRKHERPEAT